MSRTPHNSQVHQASRRGSSRPCRAQEPADRFPRVQTYTLSLALFLTATTSAWAGAPAPGDAKTLYQEGHYLEAARAFEASWRQSQRAGVLFNAGLAREAAGPGNDALAVTDWRRFLALADNVTPEERADLDRRISAAQARMAAIELVYRGSPENHPTGVTLRRRDADEADRLEFDWPAGQTKLETHVDLSEWTVQILGHESIAQELRFTARRASGEPLRLVVSAALSDQPVTLALGPKLARKRGVSVSLESPAGEAPPVTESHEPSHTRPLAAGPWTLRASAKGFEPKESLITVVDQPLTVDLELERDSMDRARIGLTAGLGGASVGFLIGGLPLLHAARNGAVGDYTAIDDNTDNVSDPTKDANEQHNRMRTSLTLVGTGVGLVAPAVTVAARGKTRALAVEAAVGGALLVGGSVLLSNAKGCYEDTKTNILENPMTATFQGFSGCTARDLWGNSTLGLGAGLLGGAAISMVTQAIVNKRRRRQRPAPSLGFTGGRQGASLSWVGHF